MKSLRLRFILPMLNSMNVREVNKRYFYSWPILTDVPTNKHLKPNAIYPSFIISQNKSRKAVDEDNENEEDFFNDDRSLTKDSKILKFNTTSLRTDAVLKSALGGSRNKIEELFYESKIRVNGKKILKKSAPVRQDYEIDVIKHISPKNPDHLYVARVEVLNIVAKEETIQFTVRRFKNLLIENYEIDPYKPGSAETSE